MAPIKVGIIGLNAKSGWGVAAHLPYLAASPKYTITALCNSSVESAQASIKAHNLPDTTRAYGSPEAIAKDNNLNLIVCLTRVDKHYETIKPALQAGRNCFIEWPLAANQEQNKELLAIARSSGSKIVIGLQAQASPLIKQLKKIVASGRLGRLLNVSFSSWGFLGGTTVSAGAAYLVEKKIGGNFVTIAAGHALDTVLAPLGELSALSAQLAILRPKVNVLDEQGKVIKTLERDSPDYIAIQGKFADSGAIFTANIGGGTPPKGSPLSTWHIEGEKAVVTITLPHFINLAPGAILKVHDNGAEESELIDVEEKDELLKQLPHAAQVVGSLYEAYADGPSGSWPDGEWALMRHSLLEALYESDESGHRTSYTRV